uniref:Uncharacterized protein n=1 Tax=Tanacetum cinerariifolium TaxID=118510 RepID=A0A699JCF6_TANCI|nr:hypothetical protein [Tanacetum cinerariifolium]
MGKVRYGNKTIDDTTRERRYYKWVAQNSKFKDHDSSHEEKMYDNPCEYHHEYPRSYVPQKNKDMLKPQESLFNEEYTNNMTPIVGTSQKLTLKERKGMPWMMCGKNAKSSMRAHHTHGTMRDSKKKNNGKLFDDAMPLGRVNRSRFVEMIRKEIDEEGGTIRKM